MVQKPPDWMNAVTRGGQLAQRGVALADRHLSPPRNTTLRKYQSERFSNVLVALVEITFQRMSQPFGKVAIKRLTVEAPTAHLPKPVDGR